MKKEDRWIGDRDYANTLHHVLHGGGSRHFGANRWFDKTFHAILGKVRETILMMLIINYISNVFFIVVTVRQNRTATGVVNIKRESMFAGRNVGSDVWAFFWRGTGYLCTFRVNNGESRLHAAAGREFSAIASSSAREVGVVPHRAKLERYQRSHDKLRCVSNEQNCRDLYYLTTSHFLYRVYISLSRFLQKSLNVNRNEFLLSRLVEDLDLCIMRFEDYSKEFVKTCKVSPDAYIQLALQLTYFR